MKVTLLGFEDVSYTSKKNGKQVEGVTLYIAGKRNNVEGVATDNKWVSRSNNEELCDKVLSLKPFNEPVEVDLVEEAVFGSRFPELVDIVLL